MEQVCYNNEENGRSMIEMLEKVKQPLNAVLRRQAQVFRCCKSAFALRCNAENQVTEAPLGARQRQCALAQSGRSMIEMLGVLAIIGVLSVGGIAGYSKAMHKIRLNKTIEFITHTSQNIRTFFASQKNYNGLGSYNNPEVIKKAKLVPDNMWGKVFEGTIDEYDGLVGYFGEEIDIGNTLESYVQNGEGFFIEMHSYYDEIDTETCVELATYDWKSADSGFVGLMIGVPSDTPRMYDDCEKPEFASEVFNYGAYLCAKDTVFPLSIDTAIAACEAAKRNGGYGIGFAFR